MTEFGFSTGIYDEHDEYIDVDVVCDIEECRQCYGTHDSPTTYEVHNLITDVDLDVNILDQLYEIALDEYLYG